MEHEIDQRTLNLQIALEQAEPLNILDSMTGVYTRRYFISNLGAVIERCKRYRHKLALLLVDIDDFKPINDTYGYLEGDRILKAIANILKRCARGTDVIARFGGEEFIIALPDAECKEAQQIADCIQEQIRLLSCGQGEQKRGITASMGMSCYTESGNIPIKTPEQWIQEADEALYQAKASGKNQISVHVADTPKSQH